MAGCVQKIDFAVRVVEFHDRRRYGNAAVFFYSHPVAQSVLGGLSSLDRSGHLNGSAEKQKLFRERGFPGIGMADDTECAAAFDFFL